MRSPASTARKSGRASNSGERVVDRAARHAAARDLPPSGLDSPSSPSPPLAQSPVRLVLPSHSDEHLLLILADVGICLDASVGSPSSLLQLIRANERAQADIAKAKEAGTGMDAPLVVAGGEPGEVARGSCLRCRSAGPGNVLKPARLRAGRA